jgi:hypothetical protein
VEKDTAMKLNEWRESASPERRSLIRSKVHVLLAAIGTLSSVVGIGVAINGGLEFNRTKVFVGVGIIVVSTIVYVSMLFTPAEEDQNLSSFRKSRRSTIRQARSSREHLDASSRMDFSGQMQCPEKEKPRFDLRSGGSV